MNDRFTSEAAIQISVAELALDSFEAPGWVVKTILLVLALGFPLALFFAWAYELTPEGLKKEKEVDRSQSITTKTGRKLDFVIIGLLSAGLVFVVIDNYLLNVPDPAQTESSAELRSIAVLPFVNMSNDPDQDYFSDGISEELLNLLAKIPAFRVAGRTSSFAFKGRSEDLRLIGDSLGVESILEVAFAKAAIASGSRRSSLRPMMDFISGPRPTIAPWMTSSPYRMTSPAQWFGNSS